MDLGLAGRAYVVTGGSRGLGRATADALVADGAHVVALRPHRGLRRRATAAGARRPGPGPWSPTTPTPTRPRGSSPRPARRSGGSTARWSPSAVRRGRSWTRPTRTGRAAFESVLLGGVRLAARSPGRSRTGAPSRSCCPRRSRRRWPDWRSPTGCVPDLAMVAKTLADELGPRGLRVNGLLPGPGRDRAGALAGRADRRRRGGPRPAVETIPLGRYGRPEEFGRAGGLPAVAGRFLRVRRDAARRRRDGARHLEGAEATLFRETSGVLGHSA